MKRLASKSSSRRRALRAGLALLLAGGAAAAGAGTPVNAEPGGWCAPQCDRLVIDWNLAAHQVIVADNKYANPLPATRALAMMHLAMHDAINAAGPRYATYALKE